MKNGKVRKKTQQKKIDDIFTNQSKETRRIIPTLLPLSPITAHYNPSSSSSTSILSYAVMSPTIFVTSESPPPQISSTQLRQIFLSPPVKIDNIRKHVLCLTNMIQVPQETLHLAINKRHSKFETGRTLIAHHCRICQSHLLFYGRCY